MNVNNLKFIQETKKKKKKQKISQNMAFNRKDGCQSQFSRKPVSKLNCISSFYY